MLIKETKNSGKPALSAYDGRPHRHFADKDGVEVKMVENRNNCCSQGNREKDMVCIDTYRVLDSCRDKDCFENVRV